MITLLAALLIYLGPSVQVTNVDAWRIEQDGAAITLGATYCFSGKSLIRFYRVPEFYPQSFVDEVQVEEYLHAAACKADGELGDEPSILDPTACAILPDDCAHSWTMWALAHPEQAAAIVQQAGRNVP